MSAMPPEPPQSRTANPDSNVPDMVDAPYFHRRIARTEGSGRRKAFTVLTERRKAFLVFGVLPTVLGLVICTVSFRVDVENPIPAIPGITGMSITWNACEHEWCYIVAGIIWFAAIWLYLGPKKKEGSG